MNRYSKRPSFWEYRSFLSKKEYVIVGGGMTGLITAIKLKKEKPQADILIIERSFLPSGASTKNAGFACFGSLSELIADLDSMGIEELMLLVEKRYQGLQALSKLMEGKDIDYQNNGGYEVFGAEDEESYEICMEKISFFNAKLKKQLGLENVFSVLDNSDLSQGLTKVKKLILNRAEGQLDTGKLMSNLINIAKDLGIHFFNGIGVKDFEHLSNEVEIHLENAWTFKAGKLIICNNAFADKLLPELNIVAVRNPVLVTEEIPDLRLKGCFHHKQGYIYFRNIGNRVLIGGARHLDKQGETTDSFGINPLLEDYLKSFLKKHVINKVPFKIAHQWSGILGVGAYKSPIVKQIKDNIFVGARMGGMGVAISSLVAEDLVDLMK